MNKNIDINIVLLNKEATITEKQHYLEQFTEFVSFDNRKMNLEIKNLKAQIAQLPSDNSQTEIETINGVSVLIKELERDSEMSVMRSAIDQMKQNIGSGVMILASISS